jgi:hypothetical protein
MSTESKRTTLAGAPTMIAVAFAISITSPALAVEGGVGRPITGEQITPFAGVIPADPGFIWQLGYITYEGEMGAARQTPVGGQVALGLEASFDLALVAGVYVWDTPKGHWNYASMLTVPFVWVDAAADVTLGPISGGLDDSDSGLFDLTFAPIIASYHFNELEHVSYALYVYAPTGDYEAGKLANPGLNNWTFAPTLGYTKLFMKGGLELSLLSALEFYTQNPDTNYQNGEVFRTDALLMMRTPKGFGFGAVAGWIEQISSDKSPTLPDELDGFKGHSLGLGPALTYSHKSAGGGTFDVNFRWVFEFDTKNRFEGDGGQITFGYHH